MKKKQAKKVVWIITGVVSALIVFFLVYVLIQQAIFGKADMSCSVSGKLATCKLDDPTEIPGDWSDEQFVISMINYWDLDWEQNWASLLAQDYSWFMQMHNSNTFWEIAGGNRLRYYTQDTSNNYIGQTGNIVVNYIPRERYCESANIVDCSVPGPNRPSPCIDSYCVQWSYGRDAYYEIWFLNMMTKYDGSECKWDDTSNSGVYYGELTARISNGHYYCTFYNIKATANDKAGTIYVDFSDLYIPPECSFGDTKCTGLEFFECTDGSFVSSGKILNKCGVDCIIANDCEGKPHVATVGYWKCEFNSCNWVTGDITQVCEEGETKKYLCADGTKVNWCTCVDNSWVCINSPETQCQTVIVKDDVNYVLIGVIAGIFLLVIVIIFILKRRPVVHNPI